MLKTTCFLLLLCFWSKSYAAPATNLKDQQCAFNFAKNYDLNDLVKNKYTQQKFMKDVMFWEGKFATDNIGINYATAMTYDGTWLHYESGLPFKLHDFSAASKESVHLGLLALALNESNDLARTFFNSSLPTSWTGNLTSFIYDQLNKKILTYENFNKKYPGFGGYLPWYHVNNSGISLLPNWNNAVPSLDNGEMIWGIIAAIQALKDAGFTPLSNRYQRYLNLLAETGLKIFLNRATPGIACVSGIPDITAYPYANTYNTSTGCFLDDPYEGELFMFFVELFSDWKHYGGNATIEEIWKQKQKRAKPVQFTTDTGDKISVEQGYWFSSHEQWKFMELPYFDSDVANRVYLNGERARSHFSWQKKYAGLFAAVTNVTEPSNSALNTFPNYVSAAGIQEIASQPVQTNDLFTPYGAFPLILHPTSRGYGLAWYANMLQGPLMQGPQGSTESIWFDGSLICPVQTWDSKITTVLAMNGGIIDLTRKYLKEKGKYDAFVARVNKEWTETFGSGTLQGENLDFKAPQNGFSTAWKSFPC
jgi:hypothetical protein